MNPSTQPSKTTTLIQKINTLNTQINNELQSLKNTPQPNFYTQNKNLKTVPEYLKIGELTSTTLNYPALFPLSKSRGVALELNDTNREQLHATLEDIALQLISQMHPDYYEFTIIDPRRLGGSFKHLKRLNKNNINTVIYDTDDLKKNIQSHYQESIRIINECLTHHSSINAYNEATGEPQAYRFLFLADFPFGFRDCLDKWHTLLHNSIEAGVFVFMTYDKSINVGTHQDKVQDSLGLLTQLQPFGKEKSNTYKALNIPHENLYNEQFTLKLYANPEALHTKIEALLKKQAPQKSFNPNAGISIPIGKAAGKTYSLTIGHDSDNYHGIIGGQSGKGKTVLLNNIIARGIEKYHNTELSFFLMDCAGVGFQEYEGSPHIHSLITSSNVDECVEGVKLLEKELLEREQAFKHAKVQELQDYNQVAHQKLPRLLCLIDEFHVLFTGSSRTSSYVEAMLVDKVIRVGRKFGIHLIVSTQSLGGGVRRSILDNISLRIALGMTEDQSTL